MPIVTDSSDVGLGVGGTCSHDFSRTTNFGLERIIYCHAMVVIFG